MNSGMFLPVQLAAAAALTLGKDWHDEVNRIYAKRRELVFELLDRLECDYAKKQVGLFVWAKVPGNTKNGYELSDKLLAESGVFITPGGIFGSAGNKYIRVSLCAKEERLSASIERIKNLS